MLITMLVMWIKKTILSKINIDNMLVMWINSNDKIVNKICVKKILKKY
jgi:hypothetical protein